MPSPTGRTLSEPEVQDVPGSFADLIQRAELIKGGIVIYGVPGSTRKSFLELELRIAAYYNLDIKP